MLCFPGGGWPVNKHWHILGWQRLTLESYRPRICQRRRWRNFWLDKSGRWHLSTLFLKFPFSLWSCSFLFWKRLDFFVVKQKAGKALLALKRMALLSKSESTASPTVSGEGKTCFYLPLQDIYLPHKITLKSIAAIGSHTFSSMLLACSFVSGSPFSPEAEHALETLEHKMQGPPQFIQGLKDQMVTSGSSARLSCHLTGTPQGSYLRDLDALL